MIIGELDKLTAAAFQTELRYCLVDYYENVCLMVGAGGALSIPTHKRKFKPAATTSAGVEEAAGAGVAAANADADADAAIEADIEAATDSMSQASARGRPGGRPQAGRPGGRRGGYAFAGEGAEDSDGRGEGPGRGEGGRGHRWRWMSARRSTAPARRAWW